MLVAAMVAEGTCKKGYSTDGPSFSIAPKLVPSRVLMKAGLGCCPTFTLIARCSIHAPAHHCIDLPQIPCTQLLPGGGLTHGCCLEKDCKIVLRLLLRA